MTQPNQNPWQTRGSREIYVNPWIRVREDHVVRADGQNGIYGVVEFQSYALGIVPVTRGGDTFLVGQWRYPLNLYSWEIPEGGGSLPVPLIDSAKRELAEETGLTAAAWTDLGPFHLSNSVTDEAGQIFLAQALTFGAAQPEGDEVLSVRRLPLTEAYAMAMDGRITDGVSIIGLARAVQFLQSAAAVCLLFFCCLHSAAWGQQVAARNTVPFPRYTQKPGRLDSDGLPVSGATISILGRPDICYRMPSDTSPGLHGDTFDYGLDPRTERLPLPGGGSWIFFSATFSGGGSGESQRLAVLRYEPKGSGGKIVNLLPFVTATDVTARRMWHLPDISPYPLLVVADFLWGAGESHYGAHFYFLEVWAYAPKTDQYVKVVSYRTAKKYGDESTETGAVITADRQNILRRLRSNRALTAVRESAD